MKLKYLSLVIWFLAFRFGLSMLGAGIEGSLVIGPFKDEGSCEEARSFIASYLDDPSINQIKCRQAKGDEI